MRAVCLCSGTKIGWRWSQKEPEESRRYQGWLPGRGGVSASPRLERMWMGNRKAFWGRRKTKRPEEEPCLARAEEGATEPTARVWCPCKVPESHHGTRTLWNLRPKTQKGTKRDNFTLMKSKIQSHKPSGPNTTLKTK